jgi:hypothetical protein
MVCSNETSNNHILAYYIERPAHHCAQTDLNSITNNNNNITEQKKVDDNNSTSAQGDHSFTIDNNDDSSSPPSVVFTKLAQQQLSNHSLINHHHHQASPSSSSPASHKKRSKTKPRIIVKQIYYHNYNEDIVAICLSANGTKLVLINASSTIYIIPIKNILLNLHAQQLRSSQGGSMYFYDASILKPCAHDHKWSFHEPVDVVYWDSDEDQKSKLVVASYDGKLTFISVDEKREIYSTSVGEPIKSLEIIHEGCVYSLLITCLSFNQYRMVLKSANNNNNNHKEGCPGMMKQYDSPDLAANHSQTGASLISLPKSRFSRIKPSRKEMATLDENCTNNQEWLSKPTLVRPPIFNAQQSNQGAATRVIQRVFTPAASHLGVQTGLNVGEVRDRPVTLLGYQSPNLISLIDVLGPNNNQHQSSSQQHKLSSTGQKGLFQHSKFSNNHNSGDPRLLRFYSSKHYSHQPHRPQIVCKLDSLDPDELITNLILTERFIAYTTDRDRCIIDSRNCCKLKSSSVTHHHHHHHQPRGIESLNPLIKEITFNHEEKIMLLVKSPISNDQDNIIDSFLLVTTRSIYSIEARHNCRELFINLIDSHLAIKRTLFMSKSQLDYSKRTSPPSSYSLQRMVTTAGEHINHRAFNSDFHLATAPTTNSDHDAYRNAESNLLINNFLQHREVYESICHDSQVFSTLFKLELASLYEAYADRLLQRGQLDLANRFFQMASFDHVKILGKYIRVGNYNEAIDYVKDVLNDENDFLKVMTESEKIEISKMAFECLLAKTVVERGKIYLFNAKLENDFDKKLLTYLKRQANSSTKVTGYKQLSDISPSSNRTGNSVQLRRSSPFDLCEHSPRGQDAKLSATTIVPQGCDDDEETLTSNTGTTSSEQFAAAKLTRTAKSDQQTRLECERTLIDFVRNLMPASMYEYTVDRLLDFDLIEIIDMIAQTDAQILAFLKMVVRYKEEDRLIFRLCRLETLVERLNQLGQNDITKVSINNREFLEFLTSERVNRALVKDISLTCDFYGYQHTLVQFRKYSFAALRQLDSLRRAIQSRAETNENCTDLNNWSNKEDRELESVFHEKCTFMDGDDDATDGMHFKSSQLKRETAATAVEMKKVFNDQQKQSAENIFIEFLIACLDESIEDSCRLWFNYINYYLNYIGSLEQLQNDILRMLEKVGDCRLAISLYKAIHRDELHTTKTLRNLHEGGNGGDHSTHYKPSAGNGLLANNDGSRRDHKTSSSPSAVVASYWRENMIANTPLETMSQLYNLSNLFKNEFLVRLLERTLDLLSQSVDLDALSIQ